MTTAVMAYGDPPPPRPSHIGYVVPNGNGGFTTRELDAFTSVTPVTPVPAVPLIGGTITVNGQQFDITAGGFSAGALGRELGIDLELAPSGPEPDIPIDEARRIARHRQRDIERQLRDD